jgi:N-acylglucosamine-6-phosphate 2-epimerase
MNDPSRLIAPLRGAIIVSCQPSAESPLAGPTFAAALARAAEIGGAGAVRVDGPDDVAAVRQAVGIPIVAIWTRPTEGYPVYITPDLDAARALARAGADIIAIDGTSRPRSGGQGVAGLIEAIHGELGLPVEADVDTEADGVAAAAVGADLLGTSVTGYIRDVGEPRPDLELVRRLARSTDRPIVAQRHYQTVDQVGAALDAGAHAVVVGSAITDPVFLTRRFVEGLRG